MVAPPATADPEAPYVGYVPYAPVVKELKPPPDRLSRFISRWIAGCIPALTRLYGMGFVDTMFLGMRPYTRRSVLHMLLKSEDAILSSDNEQAQDILAKMLYELSAEVPDGNVPRALCTGWTRRIRGFWGSAARFCGTATIWGRRSATTTDGRIRPASTRSRGFDGRGVGAVFVVCQGRVSACSVRHRILARAGRTTGHQR